MASNISVGAFDTVNSYLNLKVILLTRSKRLIQSYVQAISQIHFDFNWPYPIMISQETKSKLKYKERNDDNIFNQLKRKTEAIRICLTLI